MENCSSVQVPENNLEMLIFEDEDIQDPEVIIQLTHTQIKNLSNILTSLNNFFYSSDNEILLLEITQNLLFIKVQNKYDHNLYLVEFLPKQILIEQELKIFYLELKDLKALIKSHVECYEMYLLAGSKDNFAKLYSIALMNQSLELSNLFLKKSINFVRDDVGHFIDLPKCPFICFELDKTDRNTLLNTFRNDKGGNLKIVKRYVEGLGEIVDMTMFTKFGDGWVKAIIPTHLADQNSEDEGIYTSRYWFDSKHFVTFINLLYLEYIQRLSCSLFADGRFVLVAMLKESNISGFFNPVIDDELDEKFKEEY
jgi:hypothetical protein